MKTFAYIIFLIGAAGFLISCRDNYMPGILPFFATIIIFIMYKFTKEDNQILRREKDRGREILTELYDKYE